MPSNATIDSSSISFSHLKTQWNTAGFHSATAYGGTGTDPGTSNISLSEIEEAIRAVENGEGIKWLVSLTEKDAFKNRLDLLTANRIVNGTHFSKYSDFQEDISTYITNVGLLPGTPALGSIAWLKSYIDYSLQKENYISSFGEVPYLVGDWQLRQIYKFSDSRRNFVNEIFTKI